MNYYDLLLYWAIFGMGILLVKSLRIYIEKKLELERKLGVKS